MAIIKQRNRRLIGRMIEPAERFVALHHGDGFWPQRPAQAVQLLHQMWHISDGVLQDQ